jgi:hypothetical protein
MAFGYERSHNSMKVQLYKKHKLYLFNTSHIALLRTHPPAKDKVHPNLLLTVCRLVGGGQI